MRKKSLLLLLLVVTFASGCATQSYDQQALKSAWPEAHDAKDFNFRGAYHWLVNTGSMAPLVPYYPNKIKNTKVGYLRYKRTSYQELKPYMTVIRKSNDGVLVMHQIIERVGDSWIMKGYSNLNPDRERLTPRNFQGVVTDVYVINPSQLDTFAQNGGVGSEVVASNAEIGGVVTSKE